MFVGFSLLVLGSFSSCAGVFSSGLLLRKLIIV